MPRTEFRVSWLRVGNRQSRSKRVGTSRRRAEAYLAAVCAATADERYGDKVDKYKCCSGSSWSDPCDCKGETWRDIWEAKFGMKDHDGKPLLKPLVWAKIESRPTAPWEPAKVVEFADLKYGDVIRLPEDWIAKNTILLGASRTIAEDERIVVIDAENRQGVWLNDGRGEHIGERVAFGPMWGKVDG